MKKATLLFISALLGANLFSQSTCESFDNIPQSKLKSNGGLDGAHAFHVYGNLSNGGCSGTGNCYYNKWEVVNGAPSVFWYNQVPGVTAANDSNYVCLNTNGNSNPQKTDGIAYVYNFTTGNTYTVSMALRTLILSGSTTDLNIEFYLLQNAIPYTYVNTIGTSSIANIPSGALKVSTKANFVNNTGWTTVNFQIPASLLTSNYSRLWIRQTNNANAGDLGLLVDSFCISKDNVSGINEPIENNSIATLYQNYPNHLTAKPLSLITYLKKTIKRKFKYWI